MLFGPENGEQFRDPRMDRSQPMQSGMAAGANGDQEIRITVAGMPVMNMKKAGLPATGTAEVIAGEDSFAVSAEVIPRVPAHPITLRAQAGDHRDALAAGAKQRLLPGTGLNPNPQKAFPRQAEG